MDWIGFLGRQQADCQEVVWVNWLKLHQRCLKSLRDRLRLQELKVYEDSLLHLVLVVWGLLACLGNEGD